MRITAAAKDATRKRILTVAQRQFAQLGFETTTTRDVARAANIAIGTLFNYFPTKESIVDHLVGEACLRAAEPFSTNFDEEATSSSAHAESAIRSGDRLSLEEELFAHITATLRALKPFRKYLPAALETTLSPAAPTHTDGKPSLQIVHLETIGQIAARHRHQDALSTIGLQLYWTLFTGVLAFWSKDSSPRQEDTLALLDASLAMFVGWLEGKSVSN